MKVKIKRFDLSLPLPEYKTSGSVAFDLYCAESATLESGERKFIRTGYVICVPQGYALIIASRSSNAIKGVQLTNSIGVIDQDYCGPDDEIKIHLYNFSSETFTINKGDRLAQGLIVPIEKVEFEEVENLDSKSRGGFGSTGK